jgi:hypothetical protein
MSHAQNHPCANANLSVCPTKVCTMICMVGGIGLAHFLPLRSIGIETKRSRGR